ncbi:MAG: hypothetical protein HY293_23130 [Planctomycetes bacterium]|nr:hypothetical protein [Planctomycetota bacterium]
MQAGFSLSLFVSAAAAALAGILITWRSFPFRHAVAASIARVLPSLLYFGVFFSGRWTFLDDMTYLTDAIQFKYQGFDPFTILTDPYGIEKMDAVAGGSHILYTWWNLLAVWLFGDNYYAPVFLNVILSFVSAHYLGRTAREMGCSEAYARGLQLFTLFHWDILAWSSLVNLKDTLVMTLTIVSLYAAIALDRKPRFSKLLPLLISVVLLLRIRFYVPTLMAISMAAWGVTCARRRLLLIGALLLAGLALLVTGALQMSFNSEDYVITTDDFLYSVFYFLMTPIPWNIDPGYSFLLLPSILHWLFLLPALISAFRLWKENKALRLLLIYAVLVIFFYAMTPDLQGPRHRVQIAFVFAWLQYDFIYRFLTAGRRAAKSPPAPLLRSASAG